MSLKKNETVKLEIEDITNLGFGVGRHGGMVVFVSGAVKGDLIDARIIKVTKNYLVGRMERLIVPSPQRDGGRCNNAGCRSCAYKEISYAAELGVKENAVRAEFVKNGLSHLKVMPVTPSPSVLAYRNKAQYPISLDRDGRYIMGFYAPKSHKVCEARDCPISPPIFGRILDTLRGFFEEHALSVFSEESGTGLLRHVYLRRSEESGEVLLTLVINGDSTGKDRDLVEKMTSAHPEICGILLNVNRENTNVILGKEFITLFGRDYIVDTLAGVRLKISAPAFYQVNHGTAELIYAKARELAALDKNDTLLDLFCGAGSIGLSMARDAKELIGIEIVDEAVECANENALACGIENAEFYTGDASDCKRLLENAEISRGRRIDPDVMILDPPRAGCSEELLSYIASRAPRRIVYISCNPATLARDVKSLEEKGYLAGEVSPYDMFPMTGHVESVVCLTRQ